MLGCLATRHLARRFSPAVEAIAASKPNRLAFNVNASKIALSVDVPAYETLYPDSPVSADVAVVALTAPSNRPNAAPVPFTLPPALVAALDRCRLAGEFLVFDLSGRCPASSAPSCRIRPDLIR